MLNTIRSATAVRGSFDPLGTGGLFFRQPFNFANDGQQRRRFFVLRMDGNITKNHSIEGVYNDQPFRSNVDFLNSVDPHSRISRTQARRIQIDAHCPSE
jgi:hypothetical protein